MSSNGNIGIANWGPLVIGTDIDDAMLATLKQWMATYLRRCCVERSPGFMPPLCAPLSSSVRGPRVIVPSLHRARLPDGEALQADGGAESSITVGGAWQSLVACVVRGKQPAATRYLAAMYGGTVARVVLQKARGGVLNDMRLSSARYEQVPDVTGQSRWLLAAVQQFTVFTDEIVQPWAGHWRAARAGNAWAEAAVVEVGVEVLGEALAIPSGGR